MEELQQQRPLKSLLVTGGCGFIGSHFIRYLLGKRCSFEGRIVNLDALKHTSHPKNVEGFDQNLSYTFVEGSVCDSSLCRKLCELHNIDTIVHFAAEYPEEEQLGTSSSFVETNIIGTITLLEILKTYPKVHFHHISTDEVFGSLGAAGLFREETPYHPNSPYSATKASADHLVKAYTHTHALSTTLSACTDNYGPYQRPEFLIPRAILGCIHKTPILLYGTGIQIRDWLYVEDHCEALWSILRYAKPNSTYTIGGNCELCYREALQRVFEIYAQQEGSSIEDYLALVKQSPSPLSYDLRYACDNTKIKKELNWSPSTSFEQGIHQTIQWVQANSSWFQKRQKTL